MPGVHISLVLLLSVICQSLSQESSLLSNPICSLCDCLTKESQSISVNCSNAGLSSVPQELPPQTKVVYLNGNDITDLAFSPSWSSVIYLHLENNRIESLAGLEGNLYVSNIRYLNLEGNRLPEIQAHVLRQLNVDRIFLKDNPWRCDCNTIAFQLWLQEHASRVSDLDDVKCGGGKESGAKNGINSVAVEGQSQLALKTIYKIPRSDLCPQPEAQGPSRRHILLDYLNCLLLLFIVCIIFKTTYDYLWQKRTGKLPRFFKINC